MIRPLDRAQSFTVVSRGCFPFGSHEVATRFRASPVVPDQRNGLKAP